MKLLRLFLVITIALFGVAALSAQATKQAGSCGPLSDQVLQCPKFGFTYKVRFGWVDRTAEMQEESQPDSQANDNSNEEAGKAGKAGSSEQKTPEPASSKDAQTLLAVFECPPGAPGETINSAVVITAEPRENYHGVKTAADYFGAITELAEQRGFKVVNDPYAFTIGAKQVVRGDFSKERGKLTMYQSSLAMIEKGYIVAFTFIGESGDEIDELVANLSFAASKSTSKPK